MVRLHKDKSVTGSKSDKTILEAKITKHCWRKIQRNRNAEWINDMNKECEELKEGPEANIYLESVRATLKKINWKTLGHDLIHGFKELMSIHIRLAQQLSKCLQETSIRKWMMKGKTTLDPEGHQKRNHHRQPITYLPMMWKILTTLVREEIHYFLYAVDYFWKNKKEFRRGTRGTNEPLYTDQHILKEARTRRKKCSHDMEWLQEGLWQCPVNMDNSVWKCTRYPTKFLTSSWMP